MRPSSAGHYNGDTVQDAYYEGDIFEELAEGDDVSVSLMSPQILEKSKMNDPLRDSRCRGADWQFLIDEIHPANEIGYDWHVAYVPSKFTRQRFNPRIIWGWSHWNRTRSAALVISSGLSFRDDCVNGCSKWSG